jgi:hypothetical protein
LLAQDLQLLLQRVAVVVGGVTTLMTQTVLVKLAVLVAVLVLLNLTVLLLVD